jgi:hypothetical protein
MVIRGHLKSESFQREGNRKVTAGKDFWASYLNQKETQCNTGLALEILGPIASLL